MARQKGRRDAGLGRPAGMQAFARRAFLVAFEHAACQRERDALRHDECVVIETGNVGCG